MLKRALYLTVFLSILVGSACSADWLVLRGGKEMETEGQWAVKGNLLSVREVGGRPKTVLLSIIDFDATLRSNQRSNQKVAKAKSPGWHISAEGIRRLQEFTRQQTTMEAQMRARQERNAEMHTVEPAAGTVVAGAGSLPLSGGGKSQQGGQNGGYLTKGMQGIAACKPWQDDPGRYSSCLAGY